MCTVPLAKGLSKVCLLLFLHFGVWLAGFCRYRGLLGPTSAANPCSFRSPESPPGECYASRSWLCMYLQNVLLLQFGGAEEYAALVGLFPSKTRPAPPSKEALAAMGEDGQGLSREEMLRKIDPPRPNPNAEPVTNGKAWGIEAGGTNPRLKSPRALHGPPIAPAPRILV